MLSRFATLAFFALLLLIAARWRAVPVPSTAPEAAPLRADARDTEGALPGPVPVAHATTTTSVASYAAPSITPAPAAIPSAAAPHSAPAPTLPAATSNSAAPGTPHSLADILERAGPLSDPAVRARAVAAMRAWEDEQIAAGEARARELGWPVRVETPDGRVRHVVGLDELGRPLYYVSENTNSAIIGAVDGLHVSPWWLRGEGVTIGLWEGGRPRASHQEFGGRLVLRQSTASLSSHATHVAGTLIASGVSPTARGMAPAGTIDAYDSSSDKSEMTAAGAAAAGEPGKIQLSNHSYGGNAGWESNDDGTWRWYGTTATTTSFDGQFGRYTTSPRDSDALAYALPYYLMFRSGGNHRNDVPPVGATVYLSSSSTDGVAYDPSAHPPGDGAYRGGYDTLRLDSVAKNVITIGSVVDAVTGGQRDLTKAGLNAFSSWGPTDDGRVKPDLVANGNGLFSSDSGSDTAYASKSGTSMASPSACGAAALLVQLYGELFPGGAMRSSTLKALLLHTADDLGDPGPDYRFGWGLLNAQAAANLLQEYAASPSTARLGESQLTTAQTSFTQEFHVTATTPLRVTLCWTDPAGTSTSATDSRVPRLRNNLDLHLVAPDGTIHRPWVMPFVGTWTQASMALPATTGINNTDNVEQVYLAAPTQSGTWRAVVNHQGTLVDGAQHFSLLISGSDAAPAFSFATWATQRGLAGATAHATADPDGDGLVNAVEFVLGSDPLTRDAGTAAPKLVMQDGGLELVCIRAAETVGLAEVVVETSSDLVNWTDHATLSAAQTGTVRIALPAGAMPVFARLRVTLL